MRLECEPGPIVTVGGGVPGVAGVVAVEVSGRTTEPKIVIRARSGRVLEVAPGDTIGCVCAFEVAVVVLPLVITGITVGVEKRAILDEGEFARSLANNADLVSILEVATDTYGQG